MKKHIVLIGLPGAGKSTVGRIVAERLHAGFVDIDTILLSVESPKWLFSTMPAMRLETATAMSETEHPGRIRRL